MKNEFSMECHGFPWNAMFFHGKPRLSMEVNILPWKTPFPWISMDFHGVLGRHFHGMPWNLFIFHGKCKLQWKNSHEEMLGVKDTHKFGFNIYIITKC
jgi:hypothetical protein